MDTILAIYAAVVIVVILLILLDAKFPNSVFLEKAREWQTLLAAVVGFISISSAIVLEGRISSANESKQRKADEIALLESAAVDLDGIRISLSTFIQTHEQSEFSVTDMPTCVNLLKGALILPVRDPAIARRLDVIASEVTAPTYLALSSALGVVDWHRSMLGSVMTSDCATDHSYAAEIILKMMGQTKANVETLLEKIGSLVSQLRSAD